MHGVLLTFFLRKFDQYRSYKKKIKKREEEGAGGRTLNGYSPSPHLHFGTDSVQEYMVIYGIYEWIKRRRRENLHSIARLCSERVYTISASNSTCHTAGETADTLIPYNSICPREGQIFSPVHNGLCTSDSRDASLGWLTS